MGPIETQQPCVLPRKDEKKEPQKTAFLGCLFPEDPVSDLNPLESTRVDESFQAEWTEPFELLTISEDQFEDYGEVVSSCSIQNSSCRAHDSCDLSSMDPEVTSSSESVEKLSFLEDQILELEGEKCQREETEQKLRQLNKDLMKKIYSLEEQIQDQKLQLEEEKREILSQRESCFLKAERKWHLEMEKLNARIKVLQDDNAKLSQSVSALNAQNRVLEKKVQSLVSEVLETADSLEKERERSGMWEEALNQEREAWQHERQEAAQLIEDLRCELRTFQRTDCELSRFQMTDCELQCCDDRGSTHSLWEECEREKQRLADENQSLREINEDLQDALLVQNGSVCFPYRTHEENSHSKPGSPVHSIAEEIDVCTQQQISALNEQKEINRRLRQYLDRVILTVLEKDPGLLEIKPSL
ncbi:rab11 family-interacting protein 4B isoform X2 [Xenopus laevis]|uniref:Rab11 family-interacting protein 4B isoform X2 n=1 Tax=Xenopus laevis TaxID=8355 RepID=A0A8J0V7H0_XENLA|nr:rab11 family-interacting protein 4B isoform X2 [Xenopus laevis]